MRCVWLLSFLLVVMVVLVHSEDHALPRYWGKEAEDSPVVLNLPRGLEFQEHVHLFAEYEYGPLVDTPPPPPP
jgi:hypothetical protein